MGRRRDDGVVWVGQLRSARPSWLRQSESAAYCLDHFRGDLPGERLERVIRQLTLLHLITQPTKGARRTAGDHLRSDILRIGRRLSRVAEVVVDFVNSPAVLIAPTEAAVLFAGLRRSVLALEPLFGLSTKNNWRDRIKANITLDLQTRKSYNDNEVGELIAIAEGRNRSAVDAGEAHARWRKRHRQLLKKLRDERAAAMKALRDLVGPEASDYDDIRRYPTLKAWLES